jgi:Domain of unknown function (DUF4167)
MMKDTPRPVGNTRQSRRRAAFDARSKQWTAGAARIEPKKSQNARTNYERYLALARAETQIGNTVGAENYYQYAEHYLRSLSSDREGT